ncbi:MAG: diacylglycerol kinase (ATP) [Kiritimatiellia bacterium]|jgi:diacylglycerol kinase (ATP)
MSLSFRKIRVIINPNSGLGWSVPELIEAFVDHWDALDVDLAFQISQSPADGKRKVERAIRDRVDCVFAVGGDGVVNSLGSVLAGTSTVLGVIPTGSGNGFARHFNIPLDPVQAVERLRSGQVKAIDVGRVNGHFFCVTCSLGWDAQVVRSFEKSPIRGVLPYIFAGAIELLDYKPVRFRFVIDHGPEMIFDRPIIFTVANLSQYGGGARIAPMACADDGQMELVAVSSHHWQKVVPMMHQLFAGNLSSIPEVHVHQFRHLKVIREAASPIQVDGELVEEVAEVEIDVTPASMNVLIP